MKSLFIKKVAAISMSAGAILFAASSNADNLLGKLAQEQKVEILGVANILPDRIECWDAQGNPSEELTKRVRAYCETSTTISFVFTLGAKARYLIVKGVYEGWQVEGSDPVTDNSHGIYSNANSFGLARIVVPNDVHKSTVVTREYDAKVKTEYLEVKSGAKNSIQGSTYDVIGISPFTRPADKKSFRMLESLSSGKHWQIEVTVKEDQRITRSPYGYRPVDAGKQTISYIDQEGNPVTAAKYLTDPEEKDANEANQAHHKYAKAYVTWWRNRQGKVLLLTNVNPAKLKYIGILYNDSIEYRFENIAMDPK